MFIKKLFALCALILLCSCANQNQWGGEYAGGPALTPAQIDGGFYYPEYDVYGNPENPAPAQTPAGEKTVAVLLPLSGVNGALGKSIAASVEMAFLQKQPQNISMSFTDLSGNKNVKQEIITRVLSQHPDIIIGPVFAEDAQMLRDVKPESLPVISFSSDAAALGNGVFSMALFPTQSAEAAVAKIARDGGRRTVVLAPNSGSGGLMANAATTALNVYDVPIAGLFYYSENNQDSIKQAAERAAMYKARYAANTRAKEILSDILQREKLTAAQTASVSAQLEKRTKSDTLGKAPFDTVLFLGNANDSKSLASFMRYYDVGGRDVKFYGTALWDTPEMLSDLTLAGSEFAALPESSANFAKLYAATNGTEPNRLASFGFDAATIAINALQSGKPPAAYLLDPSGYRGLDGLVRLRPDGQSERALQIMQLTGNGAARIAAPAQSNFLTPVYQAQNLRSGRPYEIELTGGGINPLDYLDIPDNLRGKYKSKTYGANTNASAASAGTTAAPVVMILPEDDSDIVENPDFQPSAIDSVNRTLIDEVEMN
jgi:ABC-type branched-subunit amino acid transport system substrate-binding protein